MELWFSEYLDWLLNSNYGKQEAQKINNHGTYYKVQASSLALFLNRTDIAKSILNAIMQEPSSATFVDIQKRLAQRFNQMGASPLN